MPPLFAPPPLLAVVVGGATSSTVNLPYPNDNYNSADDDNSSADSSPSSSFSIIIVIIVIASAIIVSASIYLLIRLLSRRFRRSLRTFSVADDVVVGSSGHDRCFHGAAASPDDLISSLPLFAFDSINGKIAGGDCAVCLSRFEPKDQLRLLPLCCHAFHASCIDAWLATNQTCPLCRSTVLPTEADVLDKILSSSAAANERSNSFRIEIGSVSRRRAPSDSGDGFRRSYSIGSFEYIVDDGYEIPVESTHRRGISDCTSVDKDSIGVPVDIQAMAPPGDNLAAEVAGTRSWLRDYVDRVASISLSSRALSFRSSGRFFTGSSRRSESVVPVEVEDLEANRIGEEISELFRWLSGV